ncbi:MFS transporter [Nocardia aurantia]|uniref:Putative transport protein HsrA n=1 Tax=Nocardia aurantia TaxID=2585199 RepID=A0A7K0DK23_9NOCA|nr:MFS transporter [Nocardia aurantia]MQY26007.1 putative transport protein HsrA [Nocardia aurantia]
MTRGEAAVALGSFGACLISVFMQMIDVTIVTTALPVITGDLAASRSQQLWFVAGYSLAFACVLLTAARLGAIAGRRRMFLWSAAGFTAASLWCGMCTSAVELDLARIVAGVAGAGMAAQTIAIITASFRREHQPYAFAAYGATAGFAGMLGPILGGVLVTVNPFGLGWHVIFLMNLPLGVVAVALAWKYLRIGAAPRRPPLDLRGSVIATAALFLLLFALSDNQAGPRPWQWGCTAAALVLGGLFVVHERAARRRGAVALVRLDLFGDRGFAVGSVLVTIFFGLFTAFVFTVSVLLQEVLRFSVLRTGIAMTPFAIGAGAGAVLSPKLVNRFGVRALAAGVGLFGGLVAVGVGYLSVSSGAVNLALVTGPVFLAGFGVGVFGVPLQPIMLAGLDDRDMDEASGLLPTVEQIGNSVGLAVLSALFFRAHTLPGSMTMLSAIAVAAAGLGVLTLALPDRRAKLGSTPWTPATTK